MNDEQIRDELAEQVWGVLVAAGLRDETRGASPSVIAHAAVGNLLPIVRRIAAEELRAAAEELAYAPAAKADWLRTRAEALDPS